MAPKNFLQSVKDDPLFAAEGMDILTGEKALEEISKVSLDFEKIVGKCSAWQKLFFINMPVARYAIPISFVRAFITSEKYRRVFINFPSMTNGLNLVGSWEDAQKELLERARCYEKLYKTLRGLYWDMGVSSPVEDMLGNIVTVEEVGEQIERIKKNAKALSFEVKERRDILFGIEIAPRLRNFPLNNLQHYEIGVIPDKYAGMHKVDLVHGLPFRRGVIVEKCGPISYSLKQFDGVTTRHNFMFYLVKNKKNGLISVKICSVDKYCFVKIDKGNRDSDIRTFKYTADLAYWYQSPDNFYTNRDPEYLIDIATIVDLNRRPNLNKNLVETQKSSLLDLFLNAFLEEHRSFLLNVKEHVYGGTYAPRLCWYWFLMRSHPGFYFLSFNKSVWRIKEEPNFLGSKRAKKEDILYKSADFMLNNFSRQEIERIMQCGRIRETERMKAWKADFSF